MAEDDRLDAEGEAPRHREGRLGIHVDSGGVQPGAVAETAAQPGWCSMTQGRSVPERGPSGLKRSQLEQLTLVGRSLGVVCLRFGIMKVAESAEKWRFSASC